MFIKIIIIFQIEIKAVCSGAAATAQLYLALLSVHFFFSQHHFRPAAVLF